MIATAIAPPSAGTASAITVAPGTSSARVPIVSATISVRRVTSISTRAAGVTHAQRAAAAFGRDAGRGAVRHRAIGQVPGVVTFAGAAHRFGKDVHLGRLPAAVAVLDGRRADEGVLRDVGHGPLLEAVDARHVGQREPHDVVVRRGDDERLAFDGLDDAAHTRGGG